MNKLDELDAEGTIKGTPINDLPDSSFAYVEPGGEKDEGGKTVPRSKRHFPIKDKDGNCDPAHVRNALARLSQSEFGEKAKPAVCRCTKELKIPSEVCGTAESADAQVRCTECGQYMSQEELSSHFQEEHPGKVPQMTYERSDHKHVKLEFIVGIDKIYEDQDGLHITGILSIPRASLNGWIYLPEELANQDNKTVPMFFEHEEMFNPDAEPIGIMNTIWNESLLELEYEAIITDKEKADAIKTGRFKHVSMGASWEDFDRVRGWLFPKGVEILEGSLVADPGIPETTVSIIDHVKPKRKIFEEPMYIKDALDRTHLVNPHCTMKIIPTQELASAISQTFDKKTRIVYDSHLHAPRAGQAKNLPAGNKKMSSETNEKQNAESKDNNENLGESNKDIKPDSNAEGNKGSGQQKRKLLILTADGVKTLLQENSKFVVDAVKDIVSPFQKMMGELPKPTARVADGVPSKDKAKDVFYKALTDSLKEKLTIDWSYIAEKLKANNIGFDAIGLTEVGTAAGAQWLEDLTAIPGNLAAGLRQTCQVVIIERGAKEVHFTLLSTPTPVDGTSANAPPNVVADLSQTVTDILATPAERVLKQRLTDQAIRTTSVNLGNGIANSFRIAELLDEDLKVLTELNGLTVSTLAGSFFGGIQTAESGITSSDTMTASLLAKAKAVISRKGWQEARIPGGLVCVLSPEQMQQLFSDSNIQRFVEWTNEGVALQTGLIPRIHGVDLLVSTQVPTGSGSGSPAVTTHRAFMYIRELAVGLAFTKDLQIESVRYPEQRATTIVGSYEIAAKNKRADAVARIVTYGSG